MSVFNRIKRKWSRFARARTPVHLSATERPSVKYGDFVGTKSITIPKQGIFNSDDIFFTMGSCFAAEIRSGLARRGLQCVPAYRNIDFDPAVAIVDELPPIEEMIPSREHMNFYNTFTVRLQIEQLLGLWKQASDDHWVTKRKPAPPWGPVSYQDPYRRLILTKTPEILNEVLASINREMRSGFDAATAFIFTFGMTEVFVNKATGKVAAQKPLYGGAGGEAETYMHVSTFAENYENVSAIVDMIRERKPDSPIILTVSPVPLARTFQDADIAVVNTESKCLLRAVLGQICREQPNVYYLPSYEAVALGGVSENFRDDGRHVKRAVVDKIVGEFFTGYFTSAA